MSAAVAFLTSRLGLSIICGALILLSVVASYNWGLTHRDMVREQQRADGLHAEIYDPGTGYKDRVTLCAAALAGTQGALDRQNKAVDEMAAAMIAQTEKAQAAVDAAQARALTAQQRANALLFEQPRPGETRCDAADRLILENIQ